MVENSGMSKDDFLYRRDHSQLIYNSKNWVDYRALGVSCLFHTFLILGCAMLWNPQSKGTGSEIDRPIGIALVHQTNEGNEYFLQSSSSSSKKSASGVQSNASNPNSSNENFGPPLSFSEVLTSLAGADSKSIGTDNGLGSGLTGAGNSANGNSKGGSKNSTTTSFLGVPGTGQSFVYVVDRSDSMMAYEAAPLRLAKRELLKSLESLNEYHQFQIIFYNESPSPPLSFSGAGGRMLFATDNDKRRAKSYVQAMPGDGGTEHIPAIRLALSLAPDVIFFLTDAEDPKLSIKQLLDIQRLAEVKRTTIHAIQFGTNSGDGGWIRTLAEMNRGTYKYVDITNLDNIVEAPPAE